MTTSTTKIYPTWSRQTFVFTLSCLYIAIALNLPVIEANEQIEQAMAGLPQQRSIGLKSVLHSRHRRDQNDPCNLLLEEANACLPSANPTCGTCITTSFDMFLSTITANFTCTDFKGGVCPIVFQECLCSPCNTQVESYFNCVLNDVSNNECPVAYCDPLKDFSITPAACVDDLAFASACIGSDCLQCLSETIDFGAECAAYEGMVCDAVNIDCLSCLRCRDVVEPWLNCITAETKTCATFQCDTFASPAVAPSSVLQPNVPTIVPPAVPTVPVPVIVVPTVPSNDTTTFPTSVPLDSIVVTPTSGTVPSSPMVPVAVPSMGGPTPVTSPVITRDVPTTSMAATTVTLSTLCTAASVGMWLSFIL